MEESDTVTMSESMMQPNVFDRLLKDRIIWLGSEVRDDNANEIAAKLLLLAAEDPEKDIYLYINSPGGSITAGMAIYDTMQFVPNDIVTVGIGMAASMGQLLLTAGTKGKRYITPNARVLLHQPHGGFGGTASDIQTQAHLINDMKKRLAQITAEATGKTLEQITEDGDRDQWFSADEALEYGFVDHIRASASDVVGGGGTEQVEEIGQGWTTMNFGPSAQQSFPMPEARYILPTFEERTSYGFKRQDPYAKLFEDRIVFLGVQVDDASADDVMAQLLVLESQDPDRDIVMYINSPGGSFTAMTAIYDTMQYVRPQIQTVVLGQAASAAAVILAGGEPGKRLALPNSRILIHQPMMGEAGRGQASDIEIQAKEIARLRDWLEMTLSNHSHKSVEEVHRDIDRDKILTADEALEYGLIDQVLNTRKSQSVASPVKGPEAVTAG